MAENSKLVLVHVKEWESKMMDEMQGETIFDDSTGLRSYAQLGELIENPLYREIIDKTFAATENPDNPQAQNILGFLNSMPDEHDRKFQEEPAHDEPIVKDLEKEGKPDNDLVLMPLNLVHYLEKRLGKHRNPVTGLPQFFRWKKVGRFFKKAARVALAVAGHVVGGPIGAAAGASLGNAMFAKHKKTWWKDGLKAFGISMGANALGNVTGMGNYGLTNGMPLSSMPGAMSQFASAPWETLSSMPGAVGNMFGMGPVTTITGGINSGAAGAGAGGAGAAGAGAGAASKGMLESMGGWSGLGKTMALASIPMYMRGSAHNKKKMKRAREEQERKMALATENMNQMYDDSGMNQGLDFDPQKPLNHPQVNPNIDWNDPNFYEGGREPQYFGYKKGGSTNEYFDGEKTDYDKLAREYINKLMSKKGGVGLGMRLIYKGHPDKLQNLHSRLLNDFKKSHESGQMWKDIPTSSQQQEFKGYYSGLGEPRQLEPHEYQDLRQNLAGAAGQRAMENPAYQPKLQRFMDMYNNPPAPYEGEEEESFEPYEFSVRDTARFKRGGHVKPRVRHIPPSPNPGFIHGDEKGQADNVYTEVPQGTYIIDATTVSDAGDGNTEAGVKSWRDFFSPFNQGGQVNSRLPMVKVALSAGEYPVFPNIVANLGDGYINKGSKILDDMIERIRKYKASKGDELPPPIKPLQTYLRGV